MRGGGADRKRRKQKREAGERNTHTRSDRYYPQWRKADKTGRIRELYVGLPIVSTNTRPDKPPKPDQMYILREYRAHKLIRIVKAYIEILGIVKKRLLRHFVLLQLCIGTNKTEFSVLGVVELVDTNIRHRFTIDTIPRLTNTHGIANYCFL